MIIKTNNGTYDIPKVELESYTRNLKISKEEAIQVWLDDNGFTTNEEQERLDTKAKQVKISRDAKTVTKKEKKPREKQKNYTKIAIIEAIYKGILQNINGIENVLIKNDEKYIDFTIDNVNYTINLVAHRTKNK